MYVSAACFLPRHRTFGASLIMSDFILGYQVEVHSARVANRLSDEDKNKATLSSNVLKQNESSKGHGHNTTHQDSALCSGPWGNTFPDCQVKMDVRMLYLHTSKVFSAVFIL